MKVKCTALATTQTNLETGKLRQVEAVNEANSSLYCDLKSNTDLHT